MKAEDDAASANGSSPSGRSGPFSRFGRRITRALGRGARNDVDLVFDDGYELPISGLTHDSRRSALVVGFLEEQGLVAPARIHAPRRVAWRDLRRVHDDLYLESLREPAVVGRIAGVPLSPPEADRVVALARLVTGGTLLATGLALQHGRIAINVGGGFHHALRHRGQAFCIVHDVAVALAAQRAAGFDGRVLVVDLDLHDGDGSRELFEDDPRVHTFSVHNRAWSEPRAERDTAIELAGEVDDATYLATIRGALPAVVAAVAPDLVFYLAGADPAAGDAIGNWRISADGMFARDQLVMELVRPPRSRRPVVVLMAGGYGPDAWRYSARFFAWLLTGRRHDPPTTPDFMLRVYRRAALRLPPESLGAAAVDPDDWGLTAEDLGAVSGGVQPETRFLGYYTAQGLELALERLGLLDRLRKLGYSDPYVELDAAGAHGQTLRIWGTPRKRDLLVELRARRDRQVVPGLELLAIEWLMMQNPRGHFSAERPQLPGQRYPGLGVLNDVFAMLVLACERLGLDGITFVPSQYHLAVQARRLLGFVEPAHETFFRALGLAVAGINLGTASHAVGAGKLRDRRTGQAVAWPAMSMVLPVSEAARERVTAATAAAGLAGSPAIELELVDT